jgi:hypothetical protein
MSKQHIPAAVRQRVAEIARFRCGYCLTSQDVVGPVFDIDHIIPESKGGVNEEHNLWLACGWCNAYKGAQTHAPDPVTGASEPLFNPRQQVWSEHFRWSEDSTEIIGLTACGGATVEALKMNNPFVIPARRRWVMAGWHPPADR